MWAQIMDQIDKYLIEQLQANGRQTASELAQQVGMSVPAVGERIKRLQESGVIRGYYARVDPKQISMDVGAQITIISESSAHYNEVIEQARAHPQVQDCASVTGEGSHLLTVRTENTGTLEALLRQIQSWPGVTRTETRIILSHYKEGAVIQVPESVLKSH